MTSNPQPIKDYLAAVGALNNGQQQEASRLLAKAVGAGEPTTIMANNIVRLLAANTLANDGILKLVANNVARGSETDE